MGKGWKGSDRRERLPKDWPAWVARVRARSGGFCEVPRASKGGKVCGRPANGGVDHIDRDKGESMINLRDTCFFHHSKKTAAEGNAAKAQKEASRYRDREDHPGLIRRPRR